MNKEISKELQPKSIAQADAWLLPYGNLMTVLAVFYLLLYAFAWRSLHESKGEKFEKAICSIQKEMGGKEDLTQVLKASNKDKETKSAKEISEIFERQDELKKFTEVVVTQEKIKIVFATPLLFASGKGELQSESCEVLNAIAEILKKLPNEITVEGHTDDIPITTGRYLSNWALSLARAISVVKYFVKVENIPPERFVPIGYGEYRPVCPNDTPENRAKNRRIEINIIRK